MTNMNNKLDESLKIDKDILENNERERNLVFDLVQNMLNPHLYNQIM